MYEGTKSLVAIIIIIIVIIELVIAPTGNGIDATSPVPVVEWQS